MSKNKPTFADQMRTLIENSGETRYRIAEATGIDQATLSRFANGKGGLSMPNLDTLAEYLGWTIVAEGKPKAKPKRKES